LPPPQPSLLHGRQDVVARHDAVRHLHGPHARSSLGPKRATTGVPMRPRDVHRSRVHAEEEARARGERGELAQRELSGKVHHARSLREDAADDRLLARIGRAP
jgi:hypothetical protein